MFVSVYSSMTEAPACHVYSIHAGASQHPLSVATQEKAMMLKSTRMAFLLLRFLPPHLFPLLRVVDVSDKLPPHTLVMHLLLRQPFLPQVHIHTVHPPPLPSSFPSPPLHIHPHQSFPHIFFTPSHHPLSVLFPSVSVWDSSNWHDSILIQHQCLVIVHVYSR